MHSPHHCPQCGTKFDTEFQLQNHNWCTSIRYPEAKFIRGTDIPFTYEKDTLQPQRVVQRSRLTTFEEIRMVLRAGRFE